MTTIYSKDWEFLDRLVNPNVAKQSSVIPTDLLERLMEKAREYDLVKDMVDELEEDLDNARREIYELERELE